MREIPAPNEVISAFGEKLMLDFRSERYHRLRPYHPGKKGINQSRCQTKELLSIFGRSVAKIIHSKVKRFVVLMEKVNACPLVNTTICDQGLARLRIIAGTEKRFLWNTICVSMHQY